MLNILQGSKSINNNPSISFNTNFEYYNNNFDELTKIAPISLMNELPVIFIRLRLLFFRKNLSIP